jgi:hypothetical protein
MAQPSWPAAYLLSVMQLIADRSTVQRNRTGLAILVAFCSYVILYLIYGVILGTIIWIGSKFDKTQAWRAVTVLLLYLPDPLAAFGSQIVAFTLFRNSNTEAVFYSFSTGMVILAAVTTGISGNRIISDCIQAVLAVVAARAAVAYVQS